MYSVILLTGFLSLYGADAHAVDFRFDHEHSPVEQLYEEGYAVAVTALERLELAVQIAGGFGLFLGVIGVRAGSPFILAAGAMLVALFIGFFWSLFIGAALGLPAIGFVILAARTPAPEPVSERSRVKRTP